MYRATDLVGVIIGKGNADIFEKKKGRTDFMQNKRNKELYMPWPSKRVIMGVMSRVDRLHAQKTKHTQHLGAIINAHMKTY